MLAVNLSRKPPWDEPPEGVMRSGVRLRTSGLAPPAGTTKHPPAMMHDPDQHASLGAMYSDYFLDYASYVILERAVPHLNDGLKPVQRRILHSMKELDDGRYNKVANVVGNTMKYHPHGDQSIGDAMVQLGQKDLLIDTQGNWGNTLTGRGCRVPVHRGPPDEACARHHLQSEDHGVDPVL